MKEEAIILCPECDLLLEALSVQEGEKLVCPRCGAVLDSPKKNSLEMVLALTATGILLYAPAIFLPLLTFDAAGLESSGTIADSFLSLMETHFYFAGIMVFLTAILIPLITLAMLFTVAALLYTGRATRKTAVLFRYCRYLDEWGMLEVYMIGILVTIIKMLHMVHVQYDVGFYCFIGLLSATLGSSALLDTNYFWKEIDRQAGGEKVKRVSGFCRQSAAEAGHPPETPSSEGAI